MISSDCPLESEKGPHASGLCWGKLVARGADRCSPVLDLSTNSTADLSLSRNDHTPRRKLSLCSVSSSPGAMTASDKRHQTPDSHGIKFRALNFSAEDSPYLQYRTGHCLSRDPDLQQKNESSPAKRTRSKRCRELASPKREGRAGKDERIPGMDECFSDLRQIPGCSPLLPSPAEEAPRCATPEVTLHFDRKLVRTGLSIPPSQLFQENLPEDPTSLSFSSTPIRSQTNKTFTPFSIPFPISDASPGMAPSTFTPERRAPLKNPACGSEINRGDPAFEHARRNLFQAYTSKPACDTNSNFLMPESPDGAVSSKTPRSPSSGYVSVTSSAGSPLGGSGSSDSPLEKMDFAEAREFFERDVGEDIPVVKPESWALESGEMEDVDVLREEEEKGLGAIGEQLSLIGDFSRPYSLPIVRSRNHDLKAVAPDTVADIVAGCYDNVIDFYKVIDCRYPYEFRGGHIKNAKNIYEEEDLIREFFRDSTLRSRFKQTNRSILIFHCEFSSERAPRLLRLLRKNDRDVNAYPFLCYPEVYILEGGYKAFFERHPLLCEPASYVPMLQSDYSEDLKKIRAKSRSYQDECGKRVLKKLCATMNC